MFLSMGVAVAGPRMWLSATITTTTTRKQTPVERWDGKGMEHRA